jgi:hypothetical protein
MYKIILSDLDETLLVDHHVPMVNREAIDRARKKEIKFVVSTGRAFNMINEILDEIGTNNLENEYSICFNGGLIVENKDAKVLYFNGIGFDKAKSLLEKSKKYDVCVLVFTLDCCYIFNADQNEVDRKIEQKARFEVIEDYDMDFLKNERIAKVLFERRDMDYLKKIKDEISKDYENEVSFTFSSNRYLECNAFNIDKGIGLKWLADYLNVPLEQCVAVGDNYNDLEMIEVAGLGACVASANDDVKSKSDVVLEKDYFEGAVAQLIDEYILEE